LAFFFQRKLQFSKAKNLSHYFLDFFFYVWGVIKHPFPPDIFRIFFCIRNKCKSPIPTYKVSGSGSPQRVLAEASVCRIFAFLLRNYLILSSFTANTLPNFQDKKLESLKKNEFLIYFFLNQLVTKRTHFLTIPTQVKM